MPVPLSADSDGILRVSGTRVTLETLASAFQKGATPEEIATQYPSLPLSDVYAVVAYMLQRPGEVAQYLSESQQAALRVKEENETRFSPRGIRERLIARRRTQ